MANTVKELENPMKVITGPNTTWSYVNVWEPKSFNGSRPKFSVCLIISKNDKKTINKIKAAIEAAYNEGLSKLKGNSKVTPALSAVKLPLHDGDAERPDDEAYKNSYFVNAKNPQRPGVVDRNMRRILEPSEVYSGVKGRASITFYAFNAGVNRGIACALNNLQKLADGTPLGGKNSTAEEDFANVNDDDDHDEDYLD